MARRRNLFEALEKRIFLDTVSFAVNVPFPPAQGPGNFQVPQFNNLGGTRKLLSVTLELTLTSKGGATGLDNEGPGTGWGEVTVGTDVDLERDNQPHGDATWDLEFSATDTERNNNVQADGPDVGPDYAYPNDNDSVVVFGDPVNGTQDTQSVGWEDPPQDLSWFIGPGNVTFYYESFANNSVVHTIGGGLVQTITIQATAASLTGTLTYNFDIPRLEIVKGVIATNGNGTFTAPAGPVNFSAPGSAGVRYAGTIASDDLDWRTVNSNLENAAPGDWVSFAVVVENVGLGGTDGAFDVQIRDSLPDGFLLDPARLNLTVTDGTGAVFAPGVDYLDLGAAADEVFDIELVDPGPTAGAGFNGAIDRYDAANGRNLVVITYDLQIDPDMQVLEYTVLENTATDYNYAGLEGGPDLAVPDISDPAWVSLRPQRGQHWEWGTFDEIEPVRLQSYQPLYTGMAEPGSTLTVSLYDSYGDLIGSETTIVDPAGNWKASFFDTVMADQPHTIVLRQTFPGYGALANAGYNLRPYFSPAIQGGSFISEHVTFENVFAKRSMSAVQALYRASAYPILMGWHAFPYETLAAGPTASGI